MSLEMSLPMPPNLANARMHWRVKERERVAYLARCDTLQGLGLVPDPPPQPFTRAELRSVMRLGAAMDDDNAMHRHKWALDWLKTRGYIVDDRKKCLRWAGFPEQRVKRNNDYWLDLTLTALEAA